MRPLEAWSRYVSGDQAFDDGDEKPAVEGAERRGAGCDG
jgi:hypothetical protein